MHADSFCLKSKTNTTEEFVSFQIFFFNFGVIFFFGVARHKGLVRSDILHMKFMIFLGEKERKEGKED